MSRLGYVEVGGETFRISEPGPFDSWDGWKAIYARDVQVGHHVRLGGKQFEVIAVEPIFNRDDVRLREAAGKAPHLMWGGCLVWTYLG